MTVLAVTAHHKPHRHRAPHWRRVRHLMAKIPKPVNAVWDFVEQHRRASAASALCVVSAAGLVFWPAAAVLAAVVATALVIRGADAARIASLSDRLDAAQRELDLAREHATQAAEDLNRARAELAAYTAASAQTTRFAVVQDGRGEGAA